MKTPELPHPELQPGEIFLTNATENQFTMIGWTTKRRGAAAYHVIPARGTNAEDYFPVFVSRSEIEASDAKTLERLGVT